MASTRATASTALRRLTSGHCGCLSKGMARPAFLVPAARQYHNKTLVDASTRPLPTAPLRQSPRPDIPGRRSLFNLAAAVLNQAASGSGGPQQSLTTVRTLPYASADLFKIIADVDAYEKFLPHCTTSHVTHWRKTQDSSSSSSSSSSTSSASSTTSSWPARADLTVGWGPLSQTYSSRVYCVPSHGVVEAVSGRAGAPTLTAAERAEIGLDKSEDEDGRRLGAQTATDDDTFESLVTRWTVMPLKAAESSSAAGAAPRTRVELHIRFQFRNPLYQIAAAQVGNEMATKMIEAFETRAAELLGRKL
ncbi:Coenzyme Q-binding protein coq10, mitochondrial [Sporothrix stenoceras]|uniref:Coenzyme Q-binding protein coq10, mitochondrial n=1 Tax=Sporothrix stenoceras TaxID=5173 RepID=A0ABR3YVN0_9PEZI